MDLELVRFFASAFPFVTVWQNIDLSNLTIYTEIRFWQMVQGADMIKTINVFEKFGQGDAKKF